jgi:Ca2+-binding EF-hand superfamily protein
MDTDSSKGIAFEEFKNKTRMLKMEMDDDEITALYKHIDTNGDNNVTYQEFVEKF